MPRTKEISRRVAELDWEGLTAQLDTKGHAVTPTLLNETECEALAGLFDGGQFRSTVDMARHRLGEGRGTGTRCIRISTERCTSPSKS